MKAWHHPWRSLDATESQIQCLIILNTEICMREEAEAIEVWYPSFPRSLKTVRQGHNEQFIGQMQLLHPKPIAQILSNIHRKLSTRALMWTIHGHDSYENSKGENAKCCPPLPQALSIKGDIALGISQSCPLGMKWRCVSLKRPLAGKSVSNNDFRHECLANLQRTSRLQHSMPPRASIHHCILASSPRAFSRPVPSALAAAHTYRRICQVPCALPESPSWLACQPLSCYSGLE